VEERKAFVALWAFEVSLVVEHKAFEALLVVASLVEERKVFEALLAFEVSLVVEHNAFVAFVAL
jgi:hypothetical protein